MERKRLLTWLVVISCIIIIANVINDLTGRPYWQITRFINLDTESNFQTWFSGLILAIAALYAYKCSVAVNKGRWAWRLFALGLLGMSCDEVAMIHENVGLALDRHFSIKANWSMLFGPGLLIIILIFAIKLRGYLKGSAKAIWLLSLGAVVYVFGAFFLESTNNFLDFDRLKQLFQVEVFMEESFEILGVITIISGLMEHHSFLTRQPAVK